MWQRVRRGITLVEVVAGIALMGVLLLILLVSIAKIESQKRRADEKLKAVSALDGVLQACFTKGFPALNRLHVLPGNPELVLVVEVVPGDSVIDPFHVLRVRLNRPGTSRSALCYADIVVHNDDLDGGEWWRKYEKE